MREGGLQQPTLVVALLRPRIGKEDVDPGQRAGRDHVLDHFYGVSLNHPDIREPERFDVLEKAANTRCVHFDREKVALGHGLRDRGGCFAHA